MFMDEDDIDPLPDVIFDKAEREKQNSVLTRLPLSLQCHLAQVEYIASHPDNIPIHLAFRDWMAFASSLVYDTSDSDIVERSI